MAWADVNGVRLYDEVAGEGDPLVLIHAGIADSRMWDNQVVAFAPPFRAVRYDLRGFGRSELPPAPFAHYADLHGLLTALGIERASLVGAAMGAATAIDATLTYPAMVDALVLAAPALGGYTFSGETTETWAAIDAALERGRRAGSGAGATDVGGWSSADARAGGPGRAGAGARDGQPGLHPLHGRRD